MIELFTAPVEHPFIAIRHSIEYDKEGHIKNPAPMCIVATQDVDTIPDATDETLFDLFSSVPVQELIEGDFDYEMAVFVSIARECNEIARITRRGPGNVLIGSKAALSVANTTAFEARGGQVIADERFPDDEVLMLYKGSGAIFDAVDCPFAFDGKHLRMLPEWSTYCRRLKIT